jgi:LCP family protein required for cell wall assembly
VRLLALTVVAALGLSGGLAWGWLSRTAAHLQTNAPLVVKQTKRVLATPSPPGQPVNILLMGSDQRAGAGASSGGRSDTMLLVRIDPQAGTISMLSLPRDLWVDIPGYGKNRLNAAYAFGGPRLAVRVFAKLTGLPVNHFMDISFLGFVGVVDKLGGIYVDVDRRYYNPPGTGWAAIDLQPGYQRLDGRQALSFVRFRHDARSDFNRMVRQQIFLHEVIRQAERWSSLTSLPGVISSLARNTISDITLGNPLDTDPNTLFGIARTLLSLKSSDVYQVHVTGTPVTISGMDVLLPSTSQIAEAVSGFLHPAISPHPSPKPTHAPADNAVTQAITAARTAFIVRVFNGSGHAGVAAAAAAELRAHGYRVEMAGNADSSGYIGSVVSAPSTLLGWAEAVQQLIDPASSAPVQRLAGSQALITVIVGSSYGGRQAAGQAQQNTSSGTSTVVQQQIVPDTRQDLSRWQTLAASARGVAIMMPTVWSTGMVYDANPVSADDSSNFRSYTIATGNGNRAAVVVVGETSNQGFWHIEETTWTDPPLLSDPNDVRTINGRGYLLFYQGRNLHRVAFKANGCLYWVTNTLDDQLSNQLMLALATSMVPVH